MENVEIDVNSGVSSAPAPEALEPQVEQVAEQVVNQPEAATAPAQTVQEAVPMERFKKLEEESKFWRQKTEQLLDKVVKGEPQKPAPVSSDGLYDGMDPETERAYRQLDERNKKLIQAEAQKLAEPLIRQTQILMEHFSTRQLNEFRGENPDILQGSEEEREIVAYLNAGMPKEKAVWAVMGPKRAQAKQVSVAEVKKAKTEQKVAANLETQTVPKRNGLPETKLSFREELARQMAEAGQ
jgi:hypothetical protein